MNLTTKSVGRAYHSVKEFNEIANNFNNVGYDSINNQISFVFEELEETITAFENNDAVETLDGVCDLFVTIVGLMQKLEVAGYNVEEALKRVNENNMSKYIPKGKSFTYPKGLTAHHNKKYNVYVLKDETGKIKKPSNFQPVDISDCVPANFFNQ
jgi:phosphoribosyl-ATP pyrophosphohydrolase